MPTTKTPGIDSSPNQLVVRLPANPQMISRKVAAQHRKQRRRRFPQGRTIRAASEGLHRRHMNCPHEERWLHRSHVIRSRRRGTARDRTIPCG